MIPILIVYVLKKTKRGTLFLERLKILKGLIIRIVLFVAMLLVTNTYANNEIVIVANVTYDVLKNNKKIGTINIVQKENGNVIIYQLLSHINARYILKFNIVGKEKTIYQDGNLTYSHVYREVNSKVKADHQITFKEGVYKSGQKTLEMESIQESLVRLYFVEPIGLQEIFSDNMRKMVAVKSLGNGKYKIEFSKNKFNIFHYKNGKCVKIEAVSPLFDVKLIPQLS